MSGEDEQGNLRQYSDANKFVGNNWRVFGILLRLKLNKDLSGAYKPDGIQGSEACTGFYPEHERSCSTAEQRSLTATYLLTIPAKTLALVAICHHRRK